MLRIVSTKDGFRRAGVAHPARAVDHPDGVFTPEQVRALKDEPMLVVMELPDPPAADTGPEGGGGDAGGKGKSKAKAEA